MTSASWAERQCQWIVKLDDCEFVTTKYLILSTGYTSKAVTPDIPGIDRFVHKYHTSKFPADLDLKGKRVGVIGTGASGLQVIESIYKDVEELVVYQRTPNLATQRKVGHNLYNRKQEEEEKKRWEQLFEVCSNSSSGQSTDWEEFDLADQQKKRDFLEQKWADGNIWFGNHRDLLNNVTYNREVYDFWRSKVADRINDPEKREILAPKEPPHAFGARRPSHESSYYDAYNHDHVKLIDVRSDPFVEVTEDGVTTKSGHQKLDILIMATGFDAVVGSILNGINIRGRRGSSLYYKWNSRIRSAYGIAVADFPNFFYGAGPQAPTVFGTTPRLAENQGPWMASIIAHAGPEGVVEPEEKYEQIWDDECSRVCPKLMWESRTWYMRHTDFGKGEVQPACYYGGMAEYKQHLDRCKENGFEGFKISHIRTPYGEDVDGAVNGTYATNGANRVDGHVVEATA